MPRVLHPENPFLKVIVTFRPVPWGQGHTPPETQPETKLRQNSPEHHKSYVWFKISLLSTRVISCHQPSRTYFICIVPHQQIRANCATLFDLAKMHASYRPIIRGRMCKRSSAWAWSVSSIYITDSLACCFSAWTRTRKFLPCLVNGLLLTCVYKKKKKALSCNYSINTILWECFDLYQDICSILLIKQPH